jgi:hypothetical protein
MDEEKMGLDIRLPMGLMFTMLGAILTIYGAISDRAIYERSLGHNVNLWWGMVLLAFGLVFTYYGLRATRALRNARPRDAEGVAVPPIH